MIFPDPELRFIDCHISKHTKSTSYYAARKSSRSFRLPSSAFLMEFIAAARAAHHDVTLSARDADLLVAARALINVILLELGNIAAKIRKAAHELILKFEEFLILLVSPWNVLREHSPVQDHQKGQRNQSGKRDRYEEAEDDDRYEHAR